MSSITQFTRTIPHRPGTGTIPDTSALEPLISDLPSRVTGDNWHTADAYLVGFDLLQIGHYWEAHEVWEAVWRRTAPQSREFFLVRGLIQFANAALKEELGLKAAAAKIWKLAASDLATISGAAPVMGIAPHRLTEMVARNANGLPFERPARPADAEITGSVVKSKMHNNAY